MTTTIQVTGLPGSGKTTHIQKFLKENPNVQFLDIRDFNGIYRERKFRKALREAKGPIIAESACGIRGTGYVIRVNTPIETVYRQLQARDGHVDPEYLSLLGTQMVPAHCTLNSPEHLFGQLQNLLRS